MTTTTALTPKQAEVLALIKDPDIGEDTKKLANALGISRNGASVHVRNLRDAGALPKSKRRRRRGPDEMARSRGRARKPGSNGHGEGDPLSPDEIGMRHAFGRSEDHQEGLNEARDTFVATLEKRKSTISDAVAFHDRQAKLHGEEADKHRSVLGQVMHDLEVLAG